MTYDLSESDLAHLTKLCYAAYSTLQGVQHTFLLAERVIQQNTQGCFVECGVAHGALAAAMAYALQKHASERELHLFDSFQGIPLAGPHDHDQPGIGHHIADVNLPLKARLTSSGVSVGTVEQVQSNFRQWNLSSIKTIYHEGWFQHTLPNVDMPPIALLRLDGDLYESTQCCLRYLYSKVVTGGIVILDDYPLPGSRKAMEEYFQEHPPLPEIEITVNTGAAHWTK